MEINYDIIIRDVVVNWYIREVGSLVVSECADGERYVGRIVFGDYNNMSSVADLLMCGDLNINEVLIFYSIRQHNETSFLSFYRVENDELNDLLNEIYMKLTLYKREKILKKILRDGV